MQESTCIGGKHMSAKWKHHNPVYEISDCASAACPITELTRVTSSIAQAIFTKTSKLIFRDVRACTTILTWF